MNRPYVLETVRWKEGKVRILDQTRLPGEESYLDLATIPEVLSAIRTLAVRGAPAIGVTGALGLALGARRLPLASSAQFLRELRGLAEELAAARPTAVNLRWALERVMARAQEAHERGTNLEALPDLILGEGETILQEDLALSRAMTRHGAPLLPPKARVVSHCNTGGLATAGGGTALGVVLEAAWQGKSVLVHVDETRPLLQGARLTAWELERAGIPYRVQCDGAAAWLMRTEKVDAVLVGADRVAGNGDTANKVGTLSLALAAREYGVPFYVVAPRSSFDPRAADGAAIPIEERGADEVLNWAGVRTAPAGALAWNPAFDVTPGSMITAWITERGVERPPF